MDDRWDNDLKKRISEVFENYEDTSADEGWLLLREKYPEKAKRRAIAWLWMGSAAALLLLFLGIFWFSTTHNNNQQQLVQGKKPVKHATEPQIAQNNDSNAHEDSALTNHSSQLVAANHNDSAVTKTNEHQSESARLSNTNKGITANNREVIAAAKKKTGEQAVSKSSENNQPAIALATRPASPGADVIIANVQPKNNVQTQLNQQNANAVKIDTGFKSQSQPLTTTVKPGVNMRQETEKKSIRQLFENDKLAADKKTRKTSDNDKLIKLGVYAATYVNYAKGSSNQFNLGAGITSDVRLSKNLKFSTGVSVGQNTLTYTGQLPQQVSNNAVALTTTSNFSPAKALYLASSSSPAFKDYSANLVGLDIPLNLKFVFDPQKSGTYILAGVSSGTFINETYTYSYNNPSLYSASVSQVKDQSTTSKFNGFYFAKTLNLAFGTGYTIGRNQLVVEPFLKYPLDGLGSQQIKFGAGGLNLKFNFQAKKK